MNRKTGNSIVCGQRIITSKDVGHSCKEPLKSFCCLRQNYVKSPHSLMLSSCLNKAKESHCPLIGQATASRFKHALRS